MASVPSAGCLLAKNQYYRTRQNSESSVSSSSSCCSDAVNITEQDKAFHGLPELIDKCWWIKNFFHSEPSPPTVGRKTLSASRVRRSPPQIPRYNFHSYRHMLVFEDRIEEIDQKLVILMDTDIFQGEERP